MREALASTSLAGLGWSEDRERAVDRVAASGKAPTLGLQIWKARYMLESKAYQDAIKGLTAHYLARYRAEQPDIARMVVEEVLSEFMGPSCVSCNGARELVEGDLRVTCESCGGTGLRRYSDAERASRMKLSYARVKSLSHKFQWIMGELGGMDRTVNEIIAWELERY